MSANVRKHTLVDNWCKVGHAGQHLCRNLSTQTGSTAEFNGLSALCCMRRLAPEHVAGDEHQVGLGRFAMVRRRLLMLENSGFGGWRCLPVSVEKRFHARSWAPNSSKTCPLNRP